MIVICNIWIQTEDVFKLKLKVLGLSKRRQALIRFTLSEGLRSFLVHHVHMTPFAMILTPNMEFGVSIEGR